MVCLSDFPARVSGPSVDDLDRDLDIYGEETRHGRAMLARRATMAKSSMAMTA